VFIPRLDLVRVHKEQQQEVMEAMEEEDSWWPTPERPGTVLPNGIFVPKLNLQPLVAAQVAVEASAVTAIEDEELDSEDEEALCWF